VERLVFEGLEPLYFEDLVKELLAIDTLFIFFVEKSDISEEIHENLFILRILAKFL
jgi:hypothetical protein